MKVLFKLSKDAQVTNDYSFKRYKDPLKWVLTYSERLTYYERFEMIIWRKNDGGLDMVKDCIETQHNLKLKIEEIKEGHEKLRQQLGLSPGV